jgi:Raf kinase inhibitor-like YbhB/YbcL family protein
MVLSIRSPVFADGGEIPTQYTCEGADVSPPLAFSGVPPAAKSLALIADDPDAPDPKAPKTVYVHWVLHDLPPDTAGLPEAVQPRALPAGARVGRNDFGRTGYGGPCPPIGRHRYFFKLYALDAVLGDLGSVTKSRLLQAMKGHVVEEAQVMGTYQKTK